MNFVGIDEEELKTKISAEDFTKFEEVSNDIIRGQNENSVPEV